MARKAKANKNIDLTKGQQINGALESSSSVFDHLKNRNFPYSVKTLIEYQAQLQKMNLSDLQRHAIEIAHILPNITERTRLVKKLEDEFLSKLSVYSTKYEAKSSSSLTKEQEANILKVLNRS